MSHFNIIKLDAISSTNEFLKKKCKSSECKDGEIIWAKDQTNGRGQSRNKWLSQRGKSLTVSVYKKFDQLRTSNSFVLNACIALSIVNVLKKIGLNEVSIKWPNDIMAENKKIGGILIENIIKSEYIKSSIIGIGLNINEDKFVNLPYATSLFLEINKKIKLEKILNILIEELFKSFNQLNNRENYIINLFSSSLWKLNKDVYFKNKNHYFTAKVKGVKLSGNLIIELSDGSIFDYNSNEIKMNYID